MTRAVYTDEAAYGSLPIAANEPHAPVRLLAGYAELLEGSADPVCRRVLSEILAEMARDTK